MQDHPRFRVHANSRRAIIVAVLITIGIVLLAWLAYGYLTTRAQLQKLSQSSLTTQQQVINEIGKHLELPNEQPAVATINDASKLSDQEFFKHAQDGDKVFIFPKAN